MDLTPYLPMVRAKSKAVAFKKILGQTTKIVFISVNNQIVKKSQLPDDIQ